MIRSSLLTSTSVLILAAGLSPQTNILAEGGSFRGPKGDGIVAAPSSVKSWKSAEFKKAWKAETNLGFSSFAVADGKAFTLVVGEADGNTGEMLVCLDAKSGAKLWSKMVTIVPKYGSEGRDGNSGAPDNSGGDGPRSTPVVNDGKVYVIDTNLGVHCHNAADGKEIWMRDVMKQHAGVLIKWFNASSPVIEGDVLMLCGGGAGQALLGLNKNSGEVIWKGEDDAMTHATPVVATIHGVRQCIFFTQKGLVAVQPADGKVLWRQDYKFAVSTAASPVVWEDIVYCSAGYGVGAGAYKIAKQDDAFTSTEIWRKEGNDLANHWSTPAVIDGYLYGMFSFKSYGSGPLACVDIRTGEMKWSQPGFGPGQMIIAGDTIIATSDKGEIVAAVAKPDIYTELKREDVLDGKVWSYPVLADGRIFARSTKEGVCLEIK